MGKKQKKDVEAVLIRVMQEFEGKSKKCETRVRGNRERETKWCQRQLEKDEGM